MMPMLGNVVIFEHEDGPLPAIVVGVNEDNPFRVNLRVFPNNEVMEPWHETGVPFGDKRVNHWHWPHLSNAPVVRRG